MSHVDWQLETVELRELWLHEECGFSKWLENNVDVLFEGLGLSLTVEEREKSVGSFKVDLIAKDAGINYGKILWFLRAHSAVRCCPEAC